RLAEVSSWRLVRIATAEPDVEKVSNKNGGRLHALFFTRVRRISLDYWNFYACARWEGRKCKRFQWVNRELACRMQ
ncbi:MAG TPA: hypothetical protein VF787_06000, partial [Thermoanaerobaculia bacterium]